MVTKPCDGSFSEEIQQSLAANVNRSQWGTHACERCGQKLIALQKGSKWIPEQHWPSVRYVPRGKSGSRKAAKKDVPAVAAGPA